MIIPLKDENPIRIYPIITVLIIVLNIIVFIYELSEGRRMVLLVERMGLIPFEITHFVDLPPALPFNVYFTFISSMFLHAGFLHLLGNMLYLWVFGNNIEDSMGHFRFIIFYLLAGALAGLSQVIINPSSKIPMVGASGAVSGILGAYLVLFPKARVISLVFLGFFITRVRLPALVLLGIWIFYQIINSTQILMNIDSGGVAWFAHIGGFAAGVTLIGFFKK